jgi:CheY-like chemotaxis protein
VGEGGVRRSPETDGRQGLQLPSGPRLTIIITNLKHLSEATTLGHETRRSTRPLNFVEFTANRHARKPSETCRSDDRKVFDGLPAAPDADRVTPDRAASAALLAITDDPALRDLLLELAIEEGWGVRAVETEAEATVVVQTERPGLVLVDLDMATRAGSKFLRTLRHSAHRDIPCFAVTNSNNTMLAVTLDAPVYFKPALDGLPEALLRLFGQPASRQAGGGATSASPATSGLMIPLAAHVLGPRPPTR